MGIMDDRAIKDERVLACSSMKLRKIFLSVTKALGQYIKAIIFCFVLVIKPTRCTNFLNLFFE
jgi:hypothetical protein